MEKNIQRTSITSIIPTNHDMSDSEGELGIFEEPEGFYEAEKEPSFVDYTLQSGLKLNLRLVGHNPLWVSFLAPDSPDSFQVFCCWHPRSRHRRVLNGFVGTPWPRVTSEAIRASVQGLTHGYGIPSSMIEQLTRIEASTLAALSPPILPYSNGREDEYSSNVD